MPKVDLVIARDLIIHFSISEIWSFLNNVVKSNSKYLLITRHDTNNVNEEIHAGQYRPVNLENPPFSFNKALLYIKEDEAFKFMSLYKIDDLRAIL